MKSYADQLIEQAEQNRKLKKMSSKASGLASLLSGKDEIELLSEQISAELPVLYLMLNTRREFFAKKDPENGNVINLTKDIKKTENYLDMLEKAVSLHDLKEINSFIQSTNDKYSFDV